MTLITAIRATAAKRASYRRTLRELRAMSPDVALDLDIDRAAAEKLARTAVYGG